MQNSVSSHQNLAIVDRIFPLIEKGKAGLARLSVTDSPGGRVAEGPVLSRKPPMASKTCRRNDMLQPMKFRTGVRSDLLDITVPALFDHHLVFMHGRHRFHLTPAERTQLKTYL